MSELSSPLNMRTSKQILPGVKKIGWVDCRNLPQRVSLSAICGMPVAILTDIHDIPFFDDPACECVTKKDGAGYQDTATLKFRTPFVIPDNGFLAFVVTDVNDNSYLIGSFEVPHAVYEFTKSTGKPGTDSAGYEVEITHVSIRSMVPCVI